MSMVVRLMVASLVSGALFPSIGVADAASVAARAPVANATEWRQFRHDAHRTGFNGAERVLDAANVPSLALAWQAELGERVLSSSPAIVNGVVYIGTADGILWAYPSRGCGSDFCATPLWQSIPLAQIVDSPTVVDHLTRA